MHDGKKEMPEMWRVVLALLVFGDVPPLPLTGSIAETVDTHEKTFTRSTQSAIRQNLSPSGIISMNSRRGIV